MAASRPNIHKNINIFHCKTLQHFPKLRFLVRKYTIWQPCGQPLKNCPVSTRSWCRMQMPKEWGIKAQKVPDWPLMILTAEKNRKKFGRKKVKSFSH
jgi:hypothetical protein